MSMSILSSNGPLMRVLYRSTEAAAHRQAFSG